MPSADVRAGLELVCIRNHPETLGRRACEPGTGSDMPPNMTFGQKLTERDMRPDPQNSPAMAGGGLLVVLCSQLG